MGKEWVLADTLLASAEADASKVAVVVGDRGETYATLVDEALRFARGLQELGLERGDRVVVQAQNGWGSVVAIYGVTLAGGVFVVVNPQTKSEKLAYVLRDSGAAFLVIQDSLLGVFTGITEPAAPDFRQAIVIGERGDDPPASLSLEQVVRSSEPAPARRGIATDLAALIYTSGSTGNPKGVMMRHAERRLHAAVALPLPPALRGRPHPQLPAARLRLRPVPAADGDSARRDARARAFVHVPSADRRPRGRARGDGVSRRSDRLLGAARSRARERGSRAPVGSARHEHRRGAPTFDPRRASCGSFPTRSSSRCTG